MAPEPASASVDADLVRRRFNYEWATSDPVDGVDTYWWWARSVRVDPLEVVADDDDGGLWLIPFTTDGEDAVDFGEPQRVRESYVPVNASLGSMTKTLTERHGQTVLAANLDRPEKADPTPAAGSESHDPEEGTMTDSTIDIGALRTRLELTEDQLPDDASIDQVNEVLAAAATEPETEPTPEPEVTEPVAASDGVVQISAEQLATLQRQAAEGAAARSEQVNERREGLIRAAVGDGRIAPSERDAWRTKLQETPEASEEVLANLQKGVIPVTEEKGNAGGESASADSYPDHWFPELRRETDQTVTSD